MLQLAKEQRVTIEQDMDKGEILVEIAEKHLEDRLQPEPAEPPPPSEEAPPPPNEDTEGEGRQAEGLS